MENLTLIELDESYLPKMAELYKEAFSGEPWNDDWSNAEQLSEYMKDISMGYNALNYGLLIDGKLAGMNCLRALMMWRKEGHWSVLLIICFGGNDLFRNILWALWQYVIVLFL